MFQCRCAALRLLLCPSNVGEKVLDVGHLEESKWFDGSFVCGGCRWQVHFALSEFFGTGDEALDDLVSSVGEVFSQSSLEEGHQFVHIHAY